MDDKRDTILQVKNLNKVFGEEVKTQVLFDLNLEIKKRGIYVFDWPLRIR